MFKTFEDLEVYQKAREFRKLIYRSIKKLPIEEKYSLATQMRRAAVSITNNIAEGHGRFHYQENIQFLRHSRGSLEEIMDDLNICSDEGYLDMQLVSESKALGNRVRMIINGYVRYLRNRKLVES